MSPDGRGEGGNPASPGRPDGVFLDRLRAVALFVVFAGAASSLGSMLRAGRRTPRFLLVLFVIWVLAPFAALAWANMVSTRWSAITRTTLYWATLVVTVPLGGDLRGHHQAAGGVAGRVRVRGRSSGVIVDDDDCCLDGRADLTKGVTSRRRCVTLVICRWRGHGRRPASLDPRRRPVWPPPSSPNVQPDTVGRAFTDPGGCGSSARSPKSACSCSRLE